jgi:uncharacterized DUF497 family protein
VVLIPEFFPAIEGFQWDEGNASKNWTRHQVSQTEAEQVFINRPIVVTAATAADAEPRHFALGRTNAGRQLAIVFILRGSLLRVISARPMSRPERRTYGQAITP